MMKRIIPIVVAVSIAAVSWGQGSLWSLERCITYAKTNNLSIQQSTVSVKQAELTLESNKREFYPSLNGSVSYGLNTGRSIDPTSNDFVNSSIMTNGVSLSAGALVYSGGRVKNSIEQSRYDIDAAKLDMENFRNDVGLSVARAYLQILLVEEQLANSQVNLKQLEDQLAQTEKLINAGTLPANNRLDIEAQIASTEQILVGHENNVDISYLNLKQLLQLEPNTPFTIEKPTIDIPSVDQLDALGLDGIYDIAVQNQPNIAAGELRIKSAEKGVDIAKSALMPTISLGGGLSTNYSTIGRDFTNPDIASTGFDTSFSNAIINGSSASLGLINEGFSVNFPKANYFQQFGGNLSAFIGVSVNVPIYNKGQNKINIERSKLGVINQQYSNRIMRQGLKSDIQRAIADAKAASKQMYAAEKSVKAQEAAFQNTERRFKVGTANSFEYNTARNNLDSAKTLYVSAKYEYIFRLKIIDFYQGKSIKLN